MNIQPQSSSDNEVMGRALLSRLKQEELNEGYACFDSKDFHTGYKAFLAKQKPKFEGR